MGIRTIITGATGMVGKGVLLECLESPEVESVLAVNRHPLGMKHPKLKEIVHGDFFNLAPIEGQLVGYNACFFCLGVSSAGMSEEKYSRLTYNLTLGFAQTLSRLNPGMTFCYVTGAGTDSTEKGGVMWAKVKGRTENALIQLPFKAAYMFRPAFIRPMKGVKSSTPLYRIFITLGRPLFPFLMLFPRISTASDRVGRAMIRVALEGYGSPRLESIDINKLGSAAA